MYGLILLFLGALVCFAPLFGIALLVMGNTVMKKVFGALLIVLGGGLYLVAC